MSETTYIHDSSIYINEKILNQYNTETNKLCSLSKKEENDLYNQYILLKKKNKNEADKIKNIIIKGNLKFIKWQASKVVDENSICYINDLIQEGNYAFITHFDRYDPKTGNRICTYLSHFIRRSMIDYMLFYNVPTKISKATLIKKKKNSFIYPTKNQYRQY